MPQEHNILDSLVVIDHGKYCCFGLAFFGGPHWIPKAPPEWTYRRNNVDIDHNAGHHVRDDLFLSEDLVP